MSKERQQRRAAREQELAAQAAAREAAQRKAVRRQERKQAWFGWLPNRTSRQTGVLAQRKRQQTSATIAMLLAINVLVWVFIPGWPARAMVAVVSILAAPVLHTMLFRR